MLLKGIKLFLGKSWPHRFSAQRRKLRTRGLRLCIYLFLPGSQTSVKSLMLSAFTSLSLPSERRQWM